MTVVKMAKPRSGSGMTAYCICDNCGKEFTRARELTTKLKHHFCNRICFKEDRHKVVRIHKTGKKHFSWKGGTKRDGGDYLKTMTKGHPHADDRGYVFQHRLVMERAIGRRLALEEVVHHIDGNGFNNKLSNLMLFSNTTEHMSFHKRIKREKLLPYYDYMGNLQLVNMGTGKFGFQAKT